MVLLLSGLHSGQLFEVQDIVLLLKVSLKHRRNGLSS